MLENTIIQSFVHQLQNLPVLIFGAEPLLSAGEASVPCTGSTGTTVADLIAVIQNLHDLGVTLAVPLASLLYLVAGIYWMRGTPPAQEFAKKLFINTTIGLAIVLVSGELVGIVVGPICGGGR